MSEPLVVEFIENIFANMAKRGVTEVVAQADSLGQVFIKIQGASNRARYLGDFQGVSEAGNIMVALRGNEYLSLMFEAAESLGMDNTVAVALKGGTYRTGLFGSEPAA
jgi:hypothetical protein